MNKLIGWLLIVVPIMVIIGWFAQNDILWKVIDIYLIIIGLVGGVIFLQKNA
ncbi:MAG: hypothetical protein NTY14_08645 [Candidatus Omnitrophica bacterium]|nr:hypothetical protein [Candidatus Omnitrophota bacterium]